MQRNPKELYEFGPFRLDVRERLLTRDGAALPLTPKAFETLLALVENAGHLLEKDDLLRRVWPDTFVEEATLAKNVFTLRKVLGEDQGAPQFIETVPKVGYRFALPVQKIELSTPIPVAEVEVPEPETASPKGNAWRWKTAAAVLAAVLVVAGGYYIRLKARRGAGPSIGKTRLVVLPFDNLSGDSSQDFLSEGLTEEIITQVAELDPGRLGVIARNSAMQYRHTSKSAAQIGSELGAAYLLEGSVRREGDQVRVTAQLIRTSDQVHIWAESYDRDLRHILALQNDIARAVASKIAGKLSSEERLWLAVEYQVDPLAYELYLKARHLWNRRTADSIAKAADLLQQAIARDPNYARAHAALADCYVIQHIYSAGPSWNALRLAQEEASRALELNPLLGEAYASRAYARVFDWNFAAAETDFRKSFQLSPHYATAHQWYGEFLRMMGRQQEAIEESKRALELDPLSLIINDEAALPYYYLGDYDAAVAQLKRTLELDPYFGSAHGHLAMVYAARGWYQDALREGLEAQRLADAPWIEETLAIVQIHLGHPEETRRIMQNLRSGHLDPGEVAGLLAAIYANLGDKEKALEEEERAYREHSSTSTWLKVDPFAAPVRDDPRFQDMLRRIGFPPG